MRTPHRRNPPSRVIAQSPVRVRIVAAAITFALVQTACGAKTGLFAPDVPVPDVVDVQVPDVPPPPPPICVEPQPDAEGPLVVDLRTNAQVAVADVLFVIDRTGSMDQEIANVRDNLRSVIVPGLVRAIPDLNLGMVTYADFPVMPYGGAGDRVFTLEQPMGRDYTALQGALTNITADGGGDNAEGMVEALYQVATGEGLGRFISRSSGCPNLGVGFACIRPRAQPIIVLIGDAPTHNGPSRTPITNSHLYDRSMFPPDAVPHTYAEMITALNTRLHARVVGINSGLRPYYGRDDMVQIASDTGTLGGNGMPLVFDIGQDGAGLGQQVVAAIQQFTAEVRFDVRARAVDIDGSGGARMVTAIRPQRADPMHQIVRLDDMTFFSVVPGTRLTFGLEIDRSIIVPTTQEQRFTVRIEFLADGRPTLGFEDVDIIVPALHEDCPPPR